MNIDFSIEFVCNGIIYLNVFPHLWFMLTFRLVEEFGLPQLHTQLANMFRKKRLEVCEEEHFLSIYYILQSTKEAGRYNYFKSIAKQKNGFRPKISMETNDKN